MLLRLLLGRLRRFCCKSLIAVDGEDLILAGTLAACRALEGLFEPGLPAGQAGDVPTLRFVKTFALVADAALESSLLTSRALVWVGLRALSGGLGCNGLEDGRVNSEWVTRSCFLLARLHMASDRLRVAVSVPRLHLLCKS